MSVTLALIVSTCIASFYAWQNPSFYQSWMLNPYQVVKKHQYYRFITSGFVHADTGHLFFNMLSLYFIGEGIEGLFITLFKSYGQALYLLLYLAGVIVLMFLPFSKTATTPITIRWERRGRCRRFCLRLFCTCRSCRCVCILRFVCQDLYLGCCIWGILFTNRGRVGAT